MTDSTSDGRIFKVIVLVSRVERSFVYTVRNGLTMEEAETLMQSTIEDAQRGLYIPVMGAYPRAVNPEHIVEIGIEEWMI